MQKRLMIGAVVGALAVGVTACGSSSDSTTSSSSVSGAVAVDGSSTVFPFAQAAAEGFQSANPDAKVTVGESGTGGGFEKFCAGEIDIADASRPIDDADEVPICKKNKVEYAQIEVANDGIAIVTNPSLKMACLTTDQLNQLWKKGSDVSNYSQLGSGVPAGKVSLYGPGTDSGTFDFFTEEINGESGNIRNDYINIGEDDLLAVQGVTGGLGAMAFIPYSYYQENLDNVKALEVDGGAGCIAPTLENVQNLSYAPLGRGLFTYFSNTALTRPEVLAFAEFLVNETTLINTTAGYVGLTPAQQNEALDKIAALVG